ALPIYSPRTDLYPDAHGCILLDSCDQNIDGEIHPFAHGSHPRFPIHFLNIYSTLFIGMDVHKDAIAVAYVAQDQGAEVTYLGASGTRQCGIDQLVRKMQSKANHVIFIYEDV